MMNEESLKNWEQENIELLTSREMGEWLHRRDMNARPQGELKEYKPLEPDYNVQCAVENLRAAYWSNEPEKAAKNFTEAEDIIISAICHHDYVVCKQPQGEWIPVSERLPNDLEPVNITWINHCPEPYYKEIKDKPFTATGVYFNGQWYWWSTLCADVLAEYSHNFDDVIDGSIEVIAWQPLPEPYHGEDMRGKKK